jgi:predicted nucleotidyltransferase component of viral defense system
VIRRNEISRLAYASHVPEKTIQKDYVITRVLRELGPDMSALGLRFKGGTCLKKAHFREYRFSEDLDFTLEADRDIDTVEETLAAVSAVLSAHDIPFDLGEPQQGASGVTYVAETKGPLGGADKLKIDVTTHELLLFPAVTLELVDEYSDCPRVVELNCYSAEEIFLEKMVCMLDPSRIQPRDLYDLGRLLDDRAVDVEAAMWHFSEKALFKGLDPSCLRDAFASKRSQLQRRWGQQLAQQVPDAVLPGFDHAERQLHRLIREHQPEETTDRDRPDRSSYQVGEGALQAYLGSETLEDVWSRSELTEDEALEIAVEEQRRERCGD